MRRFWWIPVLLVLVAGGLWMALTMRGDRGPGEDGVPPEQGRDTVRATLYFVNVDYIATGNESLPRVKPVRRVLDVSSLPHVEAVVRALMKEPGVQGLGTALGKLDLIDARVEGATAYVNVSSRGLNGGSLEERLIIEQVVRSLAELGDVRNVQFLVDGRKRETLMGHIDIRSPISADDL